MYFAILVYFDFGYVCNLTSIKAGYLLHSRFRQKSFLFKYQKNCASKSKASFQYLWVRKAQEKILRACFPREIFSFVIEGYPSKFPKNFMEMSRISDVLFWKINS